MIDRSFTGESHGVGTVSLTHDRIFQLQAVVDLVRQLPNELLTLSGQEFADLTVAISAIEVTIRRFIGGQHPISLQPVGGEDVIHIFRRVLITCPDEFPAPATSTLSFITDQQIRESLRLEVGTVNAALLNSEWRAATVLGGAAIEALLHWKLSVPQTSAAAVKSAAGNVAASKQWRKLPTNLDDWVLAQFSAVARELKLIHDRTFTQVETARDYRNLIHPGVAARRNQVCNRATALAVVSGLEHVMDDLGLPTGSIP
jgi:hypothetical protein